MADKTISAFTAAGSVDPLTDLFEMENAGGNSRKVTASLILASQSGTSFPGSPSTGVRYYRTDRHIEYFYDGTRWLSTQLFSVSATLPGVTTYAATSSAQQRSIVPKHGHTDIYVEHIALAHILLGTGNWTVGYIWPGGSIGSGITVATVVSGGHYYTETSIGAVLAAITDVDFTFTENSGSATFYPMPSIFYRLVG